MGIISKPVKADPLNGMKNEKNYSKKKEINTG
jgi:hypothetical protein